MQRIAIWQLILTNGGVVVTYGIHGGPARPAVTGMITNDNQSAQEHLKAAQKTAH